MEDWVEFKDGISEQELDNYLAKGYYRMHQFLFTTDVTRDNAFMRLLFWLRVNVPSVKLGKKQKRVYKKTQTFTVEIGDWKLNNEIEDLWQEYISHTNFSALTSASAYLFDNENADIKNIFNTKMVTIRDNGRLIAVGYFDVASNSIAAILHFYDPEYRSFSLGKYLMLLEIDYARDNNKQFYYTGYIGIGINKFDYKLFCDINATEVFVPQDDEWVLWNTIGKVGLEQKFFGFDDDELKALGEIKF